MAHDERRLEVLRAIVEDFVSTNEPVGSKALAERHGLGVSPATVRNDMAALEEEGFITHPHTSAGRIPTDKGYRLFVDQLSQVKPLSPAERRAIQRFLDGAVDLDDVVRRSVRLLAQLTRQVAVVQYPRLSRSAVRHLEIVHLAPPGCCSCSSPTPAGSSSASSSCPVPRRRVRSPSSAAFCAGFTARSWSTPAAVADLPDAAPPTRGRSPLSATLLETLVEPSRRSGSRSAGRPTSPGPPRLPAHAAAVLEALEEQVVLLLLIGEVNAEHRARQDRRGEQRRGPPVTSVVTVGYGPADRASAARVVGPTRMDYAGNIGAVRAVARYVGELLAGG